MVVALFLVCRPPPSHCVLTWPCFSAGIWGRERKQTLDVSSYWGTNIIMMAPPSLLHPNLMHHHILPCMMYTHVFGPSFQDKKIFCFNFLIQFFVYLYLDTCFLYYKGILAYVLFCIWILLLLSRVILLMRKHK